jgi:hypothetical protein
MTRFILLANWLGAVLFVPLVGNEPATNDATGVKTTRLYENRLVRMKDPQPLLADWPQFVQPIEETVRYEAPRLVDDERADLSVRAWRFCYNARGIIEMPNRLSAERTAVVVVHPWGIDDGQGWDTPQPAGVADFCTIEKNELAGHHTRQVIDPLLKRLRPHVSLVLYSLRGKEYPTHKKLYRSIHHNPSEDERAEGRRDLARILGQFQYQGEALPSTLEISRETPVADYFRQMPGLDATARYNNAGFWDLPIPVCSHIDMADDDIVYYDEQGYGPLRDYLKSRGVRHVLLTGYATDMCFCSTTAGYENLSRDFNVFLVGDATLATFPANRSPRYATNAHISFASLNQLVTQSSWIKLDVPAQTED